MYNTRLKIEENFMRIRQKIVDAAQRSGRASSKVTLVAVTKSVGLEEVQLLHSLGLRHFGENRLETAQEKINAVQDATWHMIGNLQRRKARDTVALFDTIDAVDRISLAEAIQQRCEEQDKNMQVLMEVNVSGEEAKHGFQPEDLEAALEKMQNLDRLQVKGLMTMAPFDAEEMALRKIFSGLRGLGERHALSELSMGMSHDYEIAIEEGATQVRIGRALFD